MLKKLWTLLCALLMLPACALADLAWPAGATAGQLALQEYVARVNGNLAQLGTGQVNSIFECYSGFAVLGVTSQDMAEVPEGVELTVREKDGVRYLFLLNYLARPQEVVFHRPVTSLLTGEKLEATVTLEAYQAEVVTLA